LKIFLLTGHEAMEGGENKNGKEEKSCEEKENQKS
jgi:hypothetical protein